MSDPSNQFLSTLANHLANNAAFTQHVARLIAGTLSSSRSAAPAASASAPAKRGPGRPRKDASAPAAPAAKRGPGRPPGQSSGEGSVDRVLAAIKGGASTKKEITKRAKVSGPAYSYSVKTLREKGLIRVVGTRSAAKILAV